MKRRKLFILPLAVAAAGAVGLLAAPTYAASVNLAKGSNGSSTINSPIIQNPGQTAPEFYSGGSNTNSGTGVDGEVISDFVGDSTVAFDSSDLVLNAANVFFMDVSDGSGGSLRTLGVIYQDEVDSLTFSADATVSKATDFTDAEGGGANGIADEVLVRDGSPDSYGISGGDFVPSHTIGTEGFSDGFMIDLGSDFDAAGDEISLSFSNTINEFEVNVWDGSGFVSYASGSGTPSTFTAVPSPTGAGVGLSAFGLLAGFGMRRPRRQQQQPVSA